MAKGTGSMRIHASCRFNIGIECSSTGSIMCEKCGWNPDVSAKRKELNYQHPERIQNKEKQHESNSCS